MTVSKYIPAHQLISQTDDAYWQAYWASADLDAYKTKIAGMVSAIKETGCQRVFVISQDRGWFLAGVYAAFYAGLPAVLPQSNAPELLQLLMGEGDVLLSDQPELARVAPYYLEMTQPGQHCHFDDLDPDHSSIQFYTSGSSGQPKVVSKKLRQLEAEVSVLQGLWGAAPSCRFLSTVSHHHLYAFLYSLLWPVCAGNPIVRTTFTYWGDLIAHSCQGDYILSSPAHLGRFSILEDCQAHQFGLIFSSGAPLPYEAAQVSKDFLGSLPLEVYGSTETGGIAYRQQSKVNTPWQAFDCVRLSADDQGRLAVQSPYLPDDLSYQTEDKVQWFGKGFLLLGRADRILKIEGKRVSLIELENKLKETGYVSDVVVLLLKKSYRDELGAVVVLSEAGQGRLGELGKAHFSRELRSVLSNYFDNVLIPRKWRFVEEIPTNPQGKRLAPILEKLFAGSFMPELLEQNVHENTAQLSLKIPQDLAYFAGHFKDMPVVPGVVQLHWVVAYAKSLFGLTGSVQQGHQIKFTNLMKPLDQVTLNLEFNPEKNSVKYSYVQGESSFSSGRLSYIP